MSSAFWLATRRTDRTSRIYPIVKQVFAPSDEAPDALEDAPSLGYVPIDEISLEMLAAQFYEDEGDRKDRIYSEPEEGEPGFGADPLDLLIAQQEARLACDGLWGNEIEQPHPGDEAIPMSHGSTLREACRPTSNQNDARVFRNRTTLTLKRGQRSEWTFDDGVVLRATEKETRVIYHRSHGVHGNKPTKPTRTTIRKMEG